MDLHTRVEHARHPFGPTMRIYTEPTGEAPDLERVREEPPFLEAISSLLFSAGCVSVAVKHSTHTLTGHHKAGDILAQRSPSGWLLTGGPYNLLNYGVPDIAALERFPSVLASIQEHARTLRRTDGAA
jgi:hypothetical protein